MLPPPPPEAVVVIKLTKSEKGTQRRNLPRILAMLASRPRAAMAVASKRPERAPHVACVHQRAPVSGSRGTAHKGRRELSPRVSHQTHTRCGGDGEVVGVRPLTLTAGLNPTTELRVVTAINPRQNHGNLLCGALALAAFPPVLPIVAGLEAVPIFGPAVPVLVLAVGWPQPRCHSSSSHGSSRHTRTSLVTCDVTGAERRVQ